MRKSVFDGHPMWASLENLQAALDKADGRGEPEAAESLDAVRFLVSLIRSHSEPNDTAPYSSASFQAVNSHLPNVTNEVNNYVSNGNVAHLQNAENHADTILNLVGNWPSSLLKGGAAAQANKVFLEYREDATEAVRALRESNAKLREKLATQQQESQAALQALKAEIADLSAKIKQDEARLDQALTTTNEAFTTKQTEREEKFSEWLEAQGEALEAKAMSDLSEVTNFKRRAGERLAEIERLHEDVEKVSSKAAAAILAKDYGSYSTREWASGVIAYVLGFVSLIAVGVYLIHTVAGIAKNEDVSWQYVALKLGLTLTVLGASGVAFQFGGHALSRASTNKRVQLELGTIGTFLADVEDDKAVQTAKVEFVNRMFGRAWEDHRSLKGESAEILDVSALGRVVDAVRKLQGSS